MSFFPCQPLKLVTDKGHHLATLRAKGSGDAVPFKPQLLQQMARCFVVRDRAGMKRVDLKALESMVDDKTCRLRGKAFAPSVRPSQ